MRTKIISLALVCASLAAAQNLRVVNAASLAAGSLAPGSIITVFGTGLAAGTANAADVKNPPVNLSGTTISIGGVGAGLFYVSPTQINAVINSATPVGQQSVVVRSATGATQSATVTISMDAPVGLFSLFGTGTRDGAILNAITFLLGDFSTRTANSPTYLALFATGIRPAANPQVTIGGVPVTVLFAGPAPCCAGLDQINIQLPDSLAGAGRVPVVVTQNGATSNIVQVVLLPPQGQTQFPGDHDNDKRSREIAGIAWVPGTSLVLVTDQNDDVVRVVDVKAKQVLHVIALAEGANPVAVAVTANGATALVAESGTGKVAVINLATFMMTGEIVTGPGPIRLALSNTQALAVNGDNDTVTVIGLAANSVQKTLAVGHAPTGVAIDAAANRAYVLNQNDGTISVIDLAGLTVSSTLNLGASLRPESIALTGTGSAFLTVPSSGPMGEVILLNLTTGAQTVLQANPDRSGGSTDVAFYNGKLYFANQTGGSISILPFINGTAGSLSTVRVDLGARALAIDVKDNLLVVSNEGSGTLVLVDLATNSVVGRVSAVSTSDDDVDDHGDRDRAVNLPAVQSMTPASSRAVGAAFTLTLTGSNLTGASALVFTTSRGNGGQGDNGNDKGKTDDAFTVSNLAVNSAGTQLTAQARIAANAQAGQRIVRVVTSNGESSGKSGSGNIYTVLP